MVLTRTIVGRHCEHMSLLFTLAELDQATELVGRYLSPTPAASWPVLNDEMGVEVIVKHENGTPTGAFKVRGGLVYMDKLTSERPGTPGVVSATRGNHGISLSFSGRTFGVPVVIVVPEGNGAEKNATMKSLGAELVIHGCDFEEARLHSVRIAEERGLELIPPFHPDLVRGVATYARELFTAAGPIDTVYVPVGMGSGICGLITTRDLLELPTKIVGVVAENAPAQALSFSAGHVVSTASAATFVDGVATRQPDARAAAIILGGAERIVTVSETATADAIRRLWRTTHHLPEPAGAIALAGLWRERELHAGKRVAVILTGSNMDTDMAAEVLGGATPKP